jgi:hypothetical protein
MHCNHGPPTKKIERTNKQNEHQFDTLSITLCIPQKTNQKTVRAHFIGEQSGRRFSTPLFRPTVFTLFFTLLVALSSSPITNTPMSCPPFYFP